MTRLAQALAAIGKGFHIFPVQPGEKTPHLIKPGLPYAIRWGEVATNDFARVMDWWTYSPDANIGIAAKPSGLLIVDCDIAKEDYALRNSPQGEPWSYLHDKFGATVDGSDVLREMCGRFGDDYSRLERTYRVCTASMGLHLYFRWPEGVQASQASPVPGVLDIRCNGGTKGGYVLGAGSATEKGSYVAENDLPIADAPPWMVELIREKPKPARVKPLFSNGTGGGGHSGLVNTVRHAQAGNVNASLLWAACTMCEDGVSEEECVDLLVEPYVEAGGRGGERQAQQTIRSAYKMTGAKQ
jgi:hypothetical protein